VRRGKEEKIKGKGKRGVKLKRWRGRGKMDGKRGKRTRRII
jgi:hypothetical protein